ncbi:MAG TPA: SRPBCC family protein [Casimicrobiaceae bacterium]|nr:SRPBCC family protein [Casimicrobiaceae bacterium]
MLRTSFSVDIARSPVDVYRVISNHENDVKWQSVVAEVQKLSAGPVRAGSRFRHVLALMGVRMEAELEVAETRFGEAHAFSASGGPFAFDARVILVETAAGVHVRTDIDGRARGLGHVAVVTLSHLRRREIAADHLRLKRLMEAGDL